MTSLYLGLISGTSADGIDAALVRFEPAIEVVAASATAYPPALRERLLALTAPNAAIPLDEFGALDVAVGECFAQAALDLLAQTDTPASAVHAIGSHGQTVRHRPAGPHPFSLQIGDATVIAERTGICTVADFRRADVAAGGQGAPLAPAFHAAILSHLAPCAVLNLGGIANLSLLARDGSVLGFDTGPANCLLDAWNARHHGTACDRDGVWAASGRVDSNLLDALLADPYFSAAPPKSSGREHFNLAWLEARLPGTPIPPADVQATLLALSARTIANALRDFASDTAHVLACGGGVHNRALMTALASAIAPATLASTASVGVDPDYVEAALFAWLARERLAGRPGNLPSVSGARGPRVLGAVHVAPL
jgi:anhydro-N-acetylmuramic acid kinase